MTLRDIIAELPVLDRKGEEIEICVKDEAWLAIYAGNPAECYGGQVDAEALLRAVVLACRELGVDVEAVVRSAHPDPETPPDLAA